VTRRFDGRLDKRRFVCFQTNSDVDRNSLLAELSVYEEAKVELSVYEEAKMELYCIGGSKDGTICI
jgi:hypothetical protein